MFPSKTTVMSGGSVYDNRNSVLFDGTNDYVNIDTVVGDIEGNNVGTISFWINYVAGISGDSANVFTISDGSAAEYLQINVDSNTVTNALRFHLTSSGTGSDPTLVTSAAYNDAWHHVVLTSNGSACTLYIDGGTAGLATNTNNAGQWLNDLADLDAGRIGGLRISGAEKSFTGKMDDVAIWTVALDSSTVNTIYNGGTPIDLTVDHSTGLIGYWQFNEGAGTNAIDSSGQGNNGTLVNAIYSSVIPG